MEGQGVCDKLSRVICLKTVVLLGNDLFKLSAYKMGGFYEII